MSPRMVVLALIAVSTLMVLSLSVLGARFVAETYVAQRDAESTSSPTPSETAVAVVSDEKIIEIFKTQFPVSTLQAGGSDIVVFITIDNNDVVDISSKIETISTELRSLDTINTATLVLNYGSETFDTREIEPLVADSIATANQLVIKLH